VSALWTFPSILASAFLIAWGAEAAQFLIAQGLALAVLAWLQTLPEFAVEAVIAWDAGRDPERARLAIANLTGAIRLLIGLGWPLIYLVFATAGRRQATARLPPIRLDREHAVEVAGLVPPLLYFGVILVKGRFSWIDALVLCACYGGYLALLFRSPPRGVEALADAPAVSRWAYRQRGWRRQAAIAGLFGGGGVLLYTSAQPFFESLLAVAGLLGVSQFALVQWVAPFLSEFPEQLSALYWARRVSHAPLALMNLVSSNINQWTVLAAMIPLVYGYSTLRHHGVWLDFRFDGTQRLEILVTLLQTAVGLMLLASMAFGAREAGLLFALWLAQLLWPGLGAAAAAAYGIWLAVLAFQVAAGRRGLEAPRLLWEIVRKRDRPAPQQRGPADRHIRNGEDY
jgi:cation:H+ antiporter